MEDNLRELGADHLDRVYLRVGARNAPGGEPVAERFAALAKLRADGLIRHLGVSNVDAAQLAEARAIAPVAAVENAFHVHAGASWDPGAAMPLSPGRWPRGRQVNCGKPMADELPPRGRPTGAGGRRPPGPLLPVSSSPGSAGGGQCPAGRLVSRRRQLASSRMRVFVRLAGKCFLRPDPVLY